MNIQRIISALVLVVSAVIYYNWYRIGFFHGLEIGSDTTFEAANSGYLKMFYWALLISLQGFTLGFFVFGWNFMKTALGTIGVYIGIWVCVGVTLLIAGFVGYSWEERIIDGTISFVLFALIGIPMQIVYSLSSILGIIDPEENGFSRYMNK